MLNIIIVKTRGKMKALSLKCIRELIKNLRRIRRSFYVYSLYS
nr:MAG TPA: hypothetical protein [Bacteriophage sp.]